MERLLRTDKDTTKGSSPYVACLLRRPCLSDSSDLVFTWTSQVPKIAALIAKCRISGQLFWGALEVQVCATSAKLRDADASETLNGSYTDLHKVFKGAPCRFHVDLGLLIGPYPDLTCRPQPLSA